MPTPCRTKQGKFTSCKKKGSRHKKEKESKLRTRKAPKSRTKKSTKSRTKKLSKSRTREKESRRKTPTLVYRRKVPLAPMAPSHPGGVLRPGYYKGGSRPPPMMMKPSEMPHVAQPGYYKGSSSKSLKEPCWTNRSKEACNQREQCEWNDTTEGCLFKAKAGLAPPTSPTVHKGGFFRWLV